MKIADLLIFEMYFNLKNHLSRRVPHKDPTNCICFLPYSAQSGYLMVKYNAWE